MSQTKHTFKVEVTLRNHDYPETYYIEAEDRADAEIKGATIYRAKLELQVSSQRIEVVK